MAGSYWDKVLARRLSRRRALIGTGAAAASAAFVIACGSDDDTGAPSDTAPTGAAGATGTTGAATGATGATSSGMVTQPVHVPPAQAKRGGVLYDLLRGEMRNIDPFSGQAGLNDVGDRVMSSLFTEEPHALERSAHVLQGDLAQSWESSPDGLTHTVKLRPGVKWHNVDPLNGRIFDSEDVLFSFDRYKSIGNLGSSIFNEAGPGGFVGTYSAPDESTVTINFVEPVAWGLNWFAPFGGYTATLMIIPKEADNGFDQAQKMIGTGPFYVKEYEPSVSMTLARNPDYWDQDWALVDEIRMPIIPEYATRQAQFKAGEIHWARGALVVRPTDLLDVVGDQGQLLIYGTDLQNTGQVLTYGVQTDVDGKNPFADERVRQAISMAYERDLDIDVQYNVEEFRENGLPVEVVWNSHLAARPSFAGGGWALDPRDAEFGENGKYFQYNLEEATALMSAAGYGDGLEMVFHYPAAPAFNQETRVEPMFFFLQQLGFTVIQNAQEDYTQEYIPENRDASGAFHGIAYHSITGGVPSVVDPTNALLAEHHPDAGVTFHGYNNGEGDPVVVDLLNKAKREMDPEARKALNHDVQRHLGKAQWNLVVAGTATGYWLAWPALQNFQVWNAAPSTWRTYQIAVDDSLPPHA